MCDYTLCIKELRVCMVSCVCLVIFGGQKLFKKRVPKTLADLRNAAELSLQLREKFQEKLKDKISKDGHQFYMEQMRESIINLNDF